MRFKVPVTISERYTLYIEAEDWEDAEDKANRALAAQTIQQMVHSSEAQADPNKPIQNLVELPEGVEEAVFEDLYDVGPTVGQAEEDE